MAAALFDGGLNRRRYRALFLPDRAGALPFLRRSSLPGSPVPGSCWAGPKSCRSSRRGRLTSSGAGFCLAGFLCRRTSDRGLAPLRTCPFASSRFCRWCGSCGAGGTASPCPSDRYSGERHNSCRTGTATLPHASGGCPCRGWRPSTGGTVDTGFALSFIAVIEVIRIDGNRTQAARTISAGIPCASTSGAAGKAASSASTAAESSPGSAGSRTGGRSFRTAAGDVRVRTSRAWRNGGSSGRAVLAGKTARRVPRSTLW